LEQKTPPYEIKVFPNVPILATSIALPTQSFYRRSNPNPVAHPKPNGVSAGRNGYMYKNQTATLQQHVFLKKAN